MLTSGPLVTVIVAEGVAFVSSLVYFGFKAGRLIEKIDGHERRIVSLEKTREEGGDCNEQSD